LGCMQMFTNNLIVQRIRCLNANKDGFGPSPAPPDKFSATGYGNDQIWRDNHIKDCGRITNPNYPSKGLGMHGSGNNLLVEDNLIEGCRAGGIAIQQGGTATNVTLRRNIIRHFGTDSTWGKIDELGNHVNGGQGGTGISFGHGSQMYAYDNIIYNTGNSKDPSSPDWCLFTWGDDRGHGSFFYFYNNTCHFANPAGAYGLDTWAPSRDVVAINNIYSGVSIPTARNVMAVSPPYAANVVNTNFLLNPDVASTFVGTINSAAQASDFKLKSGATAAIGKGANLSSVFTTDFAGVSRGSSFDIGAYQYTGSGVISRPSTPINLQVSR
jgi:hypothetical protein